MSTDAPEKEYPLAPARMSKTPSWVMLGFVLGALFVLALPRKSAPAPEPPPAAIVTSPTPAAPRQPAPLSRIEAVFERYGEGAVWSDNTTEVALWDATTERYSDCFEIRRIEGRLYFRSIPELTRRVIAHGKPQPESPLQFTETEEQYREWYEHGRRERPIEHLWDKPAPPPRAGAATAPKLPGMGVFDLDSRPLRIEVDPRPFESPTVNPKP